MPVWAQNGLNLAYGLLHSWDAINHTTIIRREYQRTLRRIDASFESSHEGVGERLGGCLVPGFVHAQQETTIVAPWHRKIHTYFTESLPEAL